MRESSCVLRWLAVGCVCLAGVCSGTAGVLRSLEPLPDGSIRATVSWSFATPPRSGLVIEESIPYGWAAGAIRFAETPGGTVRREGPILRIALGIDGPIASEGSLNYRLTRTTARAPAGQSRLRGSCVRLAERRLVSSDTGGDTELTPLTPVIPPRIVGFAVAPGGDLSFDIDVEGQGTLFIDRCDPPGGVGAPWTCIWTGRSGVKAVTVTGFSQPQRTEDKQGWYRLRLQPE
jgi:hypothetical protein